MLFSEKMKKIPQPDRAMLWNEYRTLCSALTLNAALKKENRLPSPEELAPLRNGAERANRILAEQGFEPSFFPAEPNFFELLLRELDAVMQAPSATD